MILALNIYRPPSNNGGIVLYHDTEISPLLNKHILHCFEVPNIISKDQGMVSFKKPARKQLKFGQKNRTNWLPPSPGPAANFKFLFVCLIYLIWLNSYFCCFMFIKCICIWSNIFLMVFEFSLTSIKFESWYHDFMTEGISPANKDESEMCRRAGCVGVRSFICK